MMKELCSLRKGIFWNIIKVHSNFPSLLFLLLLL
nr:MAG TPA: hypothetical protein [Caudoviricetes sp.]